MLLRREVFDDRLDTMSHPRELGEIGDGAHPPEDLVAVGGLHAALVDLAASDFSSPATSASALDWARLRTTTSKPGLRAHLGQARSP